MVTLSCSLFVLLSSIKSLSRGGVILLQLSKLALAFIDFMSYNWQDAKNLPIYDDSDNTLEIISVDKIKKAMAGGIQVDGLSLGTNQLRYEYSVSNGNNDFRCDYINGFITVNGLRFNTPILNGRVCYTEYYKNLNIICIYILNSSNTISEVVMYKVTQNGVMKFEKSTIKRQLRYTDFNDIIKGLKDMYGGETVQCI